MSGQHGVGGVLRRRVALYILTTLLILLAAVTWLNDMIRAGNDLLHVVQYLAMFGAALVVLVWLVRETATAHLTYLAELAERRALLEEHGELSRRSAEGSHHREDAGDAQP